MTTYNYETLSEAVNDLVKRGYVLSFDYIDKSLQCNELNMRFAPEDLIIVETYRFEGATNPDDSSVVYAIEATDGKKGVMVDAYGAYADADKAEFVTHLLNRKKKA